MSRFNYSATAELFPSRNGRRSSMMNYKRFKTAAEAVRYAIEDMPEILLRGSLLEVDEQRFSGEQIRDLYSAESFPLPRAASN